MSVATVGLGLAPTYRTAGVLAPVLLVLCRVLQALSASAEVPGALLLMLLRREAMNQQITLYEMATSIINADKLF